MTRAVRCGRFGCPWFLVVLWVSSCATGRVARPPAPEDEVARLGREITKVRYAVEATRRLIDSSRSEPYMPDLLMRLAELHVEEARYHYFIAYEGLKRREQGVTSVQARLLKNHAINVYKRILGEFPQYGDRDKALFFMAHEYRELGEYDSMRKVLEDVIEKHLDSAYRNEALIVVGDYYFDRAELEASEKYYRRVLQTPESESHAMARYKLAWVRINQEDWKGAVKYFEDTIKGLNSLDEKPSAAGAGPSQGVGPKKKAIDLRREALVDMVFPYTEVHKKADPKETLETFERLADSRPTYVAALSKLARRWFMKDEYQQASRVYRVLLTLGADEEDTLEWARRLYDGVAKGQDFGFVATDVELFGRVARRVFFDVRVTDAERKHLGAELETYARDLATKAHLFAQKGKDLRAFALAADAYAEYLRVFESSEKSAEIRANLAEARYSAEQYYLAGRASERAAEEAADKEKKEAIYTAVAAFHRALSDPSKLSRLEAAESRAGLRRSAAYYIEHFAGAANVPAVKFNVAKSYYDAGDLTHAAELFAAVVEEYPSSKEAEVAGELALDALSAQENFEEMMRLGQRLSGLPGLGDAVKRSLRELVHTAEARALERATLEAGYQGQEAVDGLIAFADRHPQSELGEKALMNAFLTAQHSGDLDRVAAIGDQLVQKYPNSKGLAALFASLGNMAVQSADFDKAAEYLEKAAQVEAEKDSKSSMLKNAADLKARLGDGASARRTYEQLIDAGGPGRRDAMMALAELLEREGDFAGAVRPLQLMAREQRRTANLTYRTGYALLRSGNAAEGLRNLKDAVELGGGSSDVAEREAAAAAAFYLADRSFAELMAQRPDSQNTGPAIQKKVQAMTSVEQELFGVMEIQSAEWAISALARLAAAYGDTARFLEQIPPPAGLDEAGAEKFRAALVQRAGEIMTKAKEVLKTCQDKAMELRVFTTSARACLKGEGYAQDPRAQEARPARGRGLAGAHAAELKQRARKNSKDFAALLDLARGYLDGGDVYSARLVLDKAAEGGANAEVYNLRGVVAYRMGDVQGAYEEFETALKEDPDNARARANLVVLYETFHMKKLAAAERVKMKANAAPDPRDPGVLTHEGGAP